MKKNKTQWILDKLASLIVGILSILGWALLLPFRGLSALASKGPIGAMAMSYIVICVATPFITMNILNNPIEHAERLAKQGIGSYRLYKDVSTTIERIVPDSVSNAASRYQLGAWAGNGNAVMDVMPDPLHKRVIGAFISPIRMIVGGIL